jgi:hypothetical protein
MIAVSRPVVGLCRVVQQIKRTDEVAFSLELDPLSSQQTREHQPVLAPVEAARPRWMSFGFTALTSPRLVSLAVAFLSIAMVVPPR